MVRSLNIVFALILFGYSFSAAADILFEGYAKINSGDQHIGYVISRYEFDSQKKQFKSTYFLKTGKGATEVSESLKAVADSELAPISYEYASLAGKDIKTIDAKFKNGNFSAVIKQNGKIDRIEKKIPKGTFLSTFLVYLMLKSKEGLKSDTNYEYQAIAEEDGSIIKGQALVGKEEMFNGLKAYKIMNTFKDSKFLSHITGRGEVLGTNALGQSIATELVATPAEAIVNQSYSATILKTLFGGVPDGTANVVSRNKKLSQQEAEATPGTKSIGIPQGQGIIIKSQPPEVKEGQQ